MSSKNPTYSDVVATYFDIVARAASKATKEPPEWSHDLICWNCGAQYRGAVDDCPHCDGYGQ